MMKLRRNRRKHDQTVLSSTPVGGTDQEPPPHPGRHHRSFFDGLDTAAGTIFGPAARSDASTPVVHRHDAAEEESESALRSIEILTDSLGHHYAVQRHQRAGSAAEESKESGNP